MADQQGRKRRRRIIALVSALVIGTPLAVGGCAVAGMLAKPSKSFDPAHVPAEPDYAQPAAWLAWPGRDGLERSTPPGFRPIDEAAAPVDVFFIHPTTYEGHDVWNAAYDAPPEAVKLEGPVLTEQLSVFNGCCRLYAPHYRQASLAGLGDRQATELAYSDVVRAFRYYIAHENRGRPFILASHSQGTIHAVQLLQREILGTPLGGRLVAAYVIGQYAPIEFAKIGLPTCDAPAQTGCILSYNASKPGARLARIVIDKNTYWWQGTMRDHDQPPAICVNPLSWRANGAAPAEANAGSLPFPTPPFPAHAKALTPLVPKLTGAACVNGMLEVNLSGPERAGFSDNLSRFLGSYHLNDYGLFYASLRRNAIDRVAAWQAAHPAGVTPPAPPR